METMAYISSTVIREAVYDSIVKDKAVRSDALRNGGANYASSIASLKTAAIKGIDNYVAMLLSIG